MFCAIATTIDRCKTENVVDVFQVVKAQRIQKPGLVRTVVSDNKQVNTFRNDQYFEINVMITHALLHIANYYVDIQK